MNIKIDTIYESFNFGQFFFRLLYDVCKVTGNTWTVVECVRHHVYSENGM